MRHTSWFLAFLFLFFRHSIGQANSSFSVSGYVFEDLNNNGVKDANEEGIRNVAISDQVNVVTTRENGFYQIQYTSTYGILFVSLPNGFQSKAWWQRVDSINNVSQINFPLVKIASPSSFTFIHASDTHISETSLDRNPEVSTDR